MRTLSPLALIALFACTEGEPAIEDNLYVLDCQTETTPLGWDDPLTDGSTPRDRLAAMGAATPVAGAWADASAFSGTFSVEPTADAPTITRVVGGVDAAQCDDELDLPVAVTLADDAATLLATDAIATTTPDALGLLSVSAELDDQPAWGLDQALEPGEQLDGIYLQATAGEAPLEGRIFALAEGDDGEVAWQRQVEILSWAALSR